MFCLCFSIWTLGLFYMNPHYALIIGSILIVKGFERNALNASMVRTHCPLFYTEREMNGDVISRMCQASKTKK